MESQASEQAQAAPERRISRYKILGPFNAGQAVHETPTLLAVKQAKQALIDKGADPGGRWPISR